MRRLLLVAALLLPAGAQAAVPFPPGDYVLPLASAGAPRQYLLRVPPAYDGTKPLPVVLVFHGTFGNMRNIATKTGMSAIADREGFFAVYPEAAGVQWNDGREDSDTKPPVDDVAFAAALLDQLQLLVGFDAKRVYATGLSSGGMLAYRLGLQLSDRIAAIAPVAGILDESLTGTPSRPVPLIAFHGTADGTVDYDGRDGPKEGEGAIFTATVGGPHPSVPATLARWAGFDGCRPAPLVTPLPDVDPTDGTHVDRLDYPDCTSGADVQLYRVDGGGHAWPGDHGGASGDVAGQDSTTTYDIDASELMWTFFAAHPMG